MASSPIEGLDSVEHGIEGKEKPAMGMAGLRVFTRCCAYNRRSPVKRS